MNLYNALKLARALAEKGTLAEIQRKRPKDRTFHYWAAIYPSHPTFLLRGDGTKAVMPIHLEDFDSKAFKYRVHY